jgi:hypothetical protein
VWQAIVVGLIVLLATLYVVWALAPPITRLRLARQIAEWGRRPERAAWITRATARLERNALGRVNGCGDCSAVQSAPGRPRETRPENADE